MNISSPSEPRRYLIAIGSPHCPNMELHSLAQVKTDIERVVKLFTSEAQGYERVLADQIRLGSAASTIKNALGAWFSSSDRKASDYVIVYYAGHGGEEGNFGSHYLFTVDSDADNLSSTAIETGSLVKCFFEGAGERSSNILLILDVCYAGQGGDQLIAALSKNENLIKGSGFWVIASVDSDSRAGDGVFINALEKVMQNFDWMPSQEEFLNPFHLTQVINEYLERECLNDEDQEFFKAEVSAIKNSALAAFVRNPKFKRQKRYQAILPNTNGLSTEYQDLEDVASGIPTDEFCELRSNYSDFVDPDINRQDINKIAFYAWELIVEDPRLAGKLFEDEKLKKKKIWQLLFPLCKIANQKPLFSDELDKFFALAEEDEELMAINYGERGYQRLLKKIITFVLYNEPSLLTSSDIESRIVKLAKRKELEWQEFFADLYLRHQCNTISIPHFLEELILSIWNEYIKYEQNRSIPKIWKFIIFPLRMSSEMKADEIIDSIKEAARQCKNFIDFKWCITALSRVIPLFDASESDLKYFNLLPEVINQIPEHIVSNYVEIQAVFLESLLTAFVLTKDSIFIKNYEDKFKRLSRKLSFHSKCRLQLEYACCLYICCQFEYEAIWELSFGQIAKNRSDIINEQLFENKLLDTAVLPKIIHNQPQRQKKSIYEFLFNYIDSLYRLYAKKRLKENHNNLRQFPALCNIYRLSRERNLAGTVVTSLKRAIESDSKRSPSFYAISTQVFSYIPRQSNLPLIQKYIEESLEAEYYSIIRNAKNIAYGLYSCYYYGETTRRQDIEFLLDYLADITAINNKNHSPKMHWAYYAGIKWNNRPQEQEFINQLFGKRRKGKVEQLKLRKNEKLDVAEFTTDMLDIINKYGSCQENSDNSIFAIVLRCNLNNPEIWNIIGTTIYNNREKDDVSALWKAAYFYSLAKCFARHQKDYDQKYCYNYIRCKAIAFKQINYQPDDFYIIDTVRYLKTSQAEFFSYKKDCVTEFFELVQQYWNQMQEETRSELSIRQPNQLHLSSIKWIRDEILKDEKFVRLRDYLAAGYGKRI